jgi:sterol desaturase/sphingolipid hydroxylase (fatty acid hydroxylase superfamily)
MMTCGGLNLIYQFWVHTEAIDRMPRWFEFVFNTPSHHRVHHGSNRQYLDRNHAGILIVWDRLFGTFEPERERVVYGLTKNIDTFVLWTVFAHEYAAIWRDVRRARTWRERLGYTFAGPGWRP